MDTFTQHLPSCFYDNLFMPPHQTIHIKERSCFQTWFSPIQFGFQMFQEQIRLCCSPNLSALQECTCSLSHHVTCIRKTCTPIFLQINWLGSISYLRVLWDAGPLRTDEYPGDWCECAAQLSVNDGEGSSHVMISAVKRYSIRAVQISPDHQTISTPGYWADRVVRLTPMSSTR